MGSYHLPAKIRKAANQNKKERDYWLKQLSGNLVRSTFPPDYPRYGDGINKSTLDLPGEDQVVSRFNKEVFSALTDRCQGNDYSLHIYMTAALVVLLARYTGYDDIIISTPIYQQENSGDLINTVLALRSRLAGDMTFKRLLLQVRETIAGAVENQNYPVELVAEQLNFSPGSEGDFPIFDIGVCVEGIHDPAYLRRIRHNIIFSFRQVAQGFEGTVRYNRFLYREGTMLRIIGHLQQLLASALHNLDTRVFDMEILTGKEKRQILYEFNDTRAQYPGNKTLHGLFTEQANQCPDNIALIGVGRTAGQKQTVHVTYRELNERCDRLAYVLIKKGVQPDTIVGIMVERTVEMIGGILAILKAGGGYLPIDTDYPEERVRYMLKDSNARVLLWDRDYFNCQLSIVNCQLSMNEETIAPPVFSNPRPAAGSWQLAYIIYTSGTTGKPKGTLITHRNVVRLLFNDKFQFDFNHGDVWTFFHSYCFDFSVWEMYGA
ncbi:MAG: AMP-binding protein, partial [Candidatus Aminicenantes bacterium]